MDFKIEGLPRRRHWKLLTVLALTAMLSLAASSIAGAGNSTLASSPVPPESIAQFGSFAPVGASSAMVGAAAALDTARSQDYGRPGTPEALLVQYQGQGTDLVPFAKGTLLWIFHWGALQEDEYRVFPGLGGGSDTPNATVFLHTDYFLFVDAASGEVIASVLR